MSLYLAVIADVINSRKTVAAFDISEQLSKANDDLKNELLVPFKCFRGDEIEAVLDINKNFMKSVRTLQYRLRPLKIRVGLGIGRLNTGGGDLPDDPFLLNGEAFFAARSAVDLIKDTYKEQESVVLRAEGDQESARFEPLDILFRLYGNVTGRWNAAQWDAAMNYEQLGSMKAAAVQLKKSYQSIQRSLERADWPLISDTEALLQKQVSDFISR